MPQQHSGRTVVRMTLLLAYATRNGSTHEVAQNIAATLRLDGFDAVCRPVTEVTSLDAVDALVLGAPLYTGRWHHDACRFVERHRDELERIPFAVFALGPRTLDPTDIASSRGQLERALRKIHAPTPATTAIFGGALDPKKLRFPFSRMPASDARDWDEIEAWTRTLPNALHFGKPAVDPRDHRSALPQAPR
jgi:menaquinone-dependent protoporphyrinogen oxidase